MQYDADGKEVEIETREDEEQNVKLEETIELLRSAGYFRARIKGLSPFDKVVGGMTWCITTCNFDVDVDLLFTENSSIGQKIALTEKIVSVLPRMKCPHRIEPHQIQGLDFIHIFPVVQWLVKKALETREEMGDYIRAYSIYQFNKKYEMPEDETFKSIRESAMKTLGEVKNVYHPQRRYRRRDADKLKDEETRVISTLLEFGWNYGVSPKVDEAEIDKKPLSSNEVDSSATEEEQRLEEERKMDMLMKEMSAMSTSEGLKTYASVKPGQSELEHLEKGELVGGVQHHKRVTTALSKQIQQQKIKLEEIQVKYSDLHKTYLQNQENLKAVIDRSEKIDTEMEKLNELESSENQGILESLRNLVAMNENLKKQEQEFKAHCKEEMIRLKQNIRKLKTETDEEDNDEMERVTLIERQYDADKEKLKKIKLVLAQVNREIALLQRKIDEVPSRAELSQYQKRFIELYNQVAAKHKETKQFYTLYNTLDDTKLYLNKEVNLLNSIHDNFSTAMGSSNTKEQFLRQMEQIVEGVKQNRLKVEKKKQEEKMKRDQYNDEYLALVENQRLYFKTIKDFQEECRKNEILMSKLR